MCAGLYGHPILPCIEFCGLPSSRRSFHKERYCATFLLIEIAWSEKCISGPSEITVTVFVIVKDI